jgi:hypothetical protein
LVAFLILDALVLAELMLCLPHLSKFTDGLEHLLTESGLLPDVNC